MSGYAEEQKHYQHGRLEPIEIMQDYMEPKEIYGFCIGNAIKYILRSRFKGAELQDIEKAHQYLKWGIDVLRGEKITLKEPSQNTNLSKRPKGSNAWTSTFGESKGFHSWQGNAEKW